MSASQPSKMLELIYLFEDTVRHPLIAENPDWDNLITPALVEIGNLVDAQMLDLNSIEAVKIVRILFESVYVLGHETGRGESTP